MSDQMNSDLKFEELIAGFSPPEQFLARQIKALQIEASIIKDKSHTWESCPLNTEIRAKLQEDKQDIALLKDRTDNPPPTRSRRREAGLMGGGGVIGGAIYAIMELIRWLMKP